MHASSNSPRAIAAGNLQRTIAAGLALLLFAGAPAGAQQSSPQTDQGGFTLRTRTELVLTNVVVRDKHGNLVRDLKPSDFTVLEDKKPQHIQSFDFETVDQAAAPAEPAVSGTAPVAVPTGGQGPSTALRNKRLIVLFFDFTTLQPEDVERAVQASQRYVDKQMRPADLVSVVTLGSDLHVEQDFTSDKARLSKVLSSFGRTGEGGFENGDTGASEGTADTGGAYTPDETEFNAFNTDRKLRALQSLALSLQHIDEKKSVLYFTGGVERTGIENQTALRAAVNAAVRANMAVYSVDMRGLEALPPVGDASTASLQGVSAYNGNAVKGQFDTNFASQETLTTLADDTGGKAFLDSNDFGPAFERVQRDTSAYYVIGYISSNSLRDGRFRHLSIRVDRPGLKLEYRPGYYAPADYKHANREGREQQLEDELNSDLPSTDLPVYMQAAYFRTDENRFFVPVSLVVPGSQIPFTHGGDKDKATLDVIGSVRDGAGRQVGSARETVKLGLRADQQVRRKNVQYSTGFELAPGAYRVKFVVRENETGRMGSFETQLRIPDLRKSPLKMSSVVLSSQRGPAKGAASNDPLVQNGQQWVPNVPHVFTTAQHLYFLYEVYDPARIKAEDGKGGVHVLTSIQFFSGDAKVFETPLVEARQINRPERHAVEFAFDVPLTQLKPGTYVCQVNVIDDAAGSFSFPRIPILVRAPQGTATAERTPAASQGVADARPR